MKALWIYEQPSRLQQMGMNVSLGKLSVTSVSSKFWWSQPINGGGGAGRWGVGRPVHSPQPKPRQKCLCLEMGSGWPAAARLTLHSRHLRWGMWLTSYLYTTVRIIWFFSHLTGGDGPLLQLISYFSSISLRVFTFVSSVAGSWCCWLPVWVVHLHSTEQVNAKATQRSSPSPFTKKKKAPP